MSQNGHLRYERKIVLRATSLHWAESQLRLHPAGFHEVFPARCVNSIYFDDPDLHTYAENISGLSDRTKIRLRWYGQTWVVRQGTLEFKSKRNLVSWKRATALKDTYNLTQESWSALVARIRRENNGTIDRFQLACWPVLINRYHRRYLLSLDGIVRVTIDRDLTTYDQRLSSRPNVCFSSPATDRAIIEFKAPVQQSSRLGDVMAAFPLRPTKSSKYAAGVEACLFR